jgi:hypothetical protein
LRISVVAILASTATAQAQNVVVTPPNNSQFGIQSVITQKRDSLQRSQLTTQPKVRRPTRSQSNHNADPDK